MLGTELPKKIFPKNTSSVELELLSLLLVFL